jgi:hypothetical protein
MLRHQRRRDENEGVFDEPASVITRILLGPLEGA